MKMPDFCLCKTVAAQLICAYVFAIAKSLLLMLVLKFDLIVFKYVIIPKCPRCHEIEFSGYFIILVVYKDFI